MPKIGRPLETSFFISAIIETFSAGSPGPFESIMPSGLSESISCADEFIDRFPDKYETMLEQNATNLSGGQKQRLCIARALLKRPKILILDDALSAVDTHTDAMIRASLKEYMPQTTKLIIAQRVLSVQDSDIIVLMEGGKIRATGTHKELLKSDEIYNEIYLSQNSGRSRDLDE